MPLYDVTWGPLNRRVEAADTRDARAMFCDMHSADTPDIQRFPSRHEFLIKEVGGVEPDPVVPEPPPTDPDPESEI